MGSIYTDLDNYTLVVLNSSTLEIEVCNLKPATEYEVVVYGVARDDNKQSQQSSAFHTILESGKYILHCFLPVSYASS